MTDFGSGVCLYNGNKFNASVNHKQLVQCYEKRSTCTNMHLRLELIIMHAYRLRFPRGERSKVYFSP